MENCLKKHPPKNTEYLVRNIIGINSDNIANYEEWSAIKMHVINITYRLIIKA